MDYISVKPVSEKWCISERRIQKLCQETPIEYIKKFGGSWMIPQSAEKPIDGRTKRKVGEKHGQ